MTQNPTLRKLLATPIFAVGSYLCVMILLLFVIGSCFTDLVSQRAEVKGLRTLLEQCEGRKPAAGRGEIEGVSLSTSERTGEPTCQIKTGEPALERAEQQ